MTVYLVGAGPGDPTLITVRGAALLARADVVVHDRLANGDLLLLAGAGAEVIDVGKRPGQPLHQDLINQVLVDRGRRLDCVVRLKGGDPFVFGRGGEEALALEEAGLAYEVVPGVTSALGVPASAGIPVTHRGLATSFTVVTGHVGHSDAPDWELLGRVGQTLVILMGVSNRAEIAELLIIGGRHPTTPVACIHWGTTARQEVVRTSLGELGVTAVEPPATIVVGEVVSLGLDWWGRRRLSGWKVAVTRAENQATGLNEALGQQGALVVALPLIDIGPPADGGVALKSAVSRLATFDWVVLTSPNGAARLMDELRDARSLGTTKVAAIGAGTAEQLARRGVVADLVPDRFVAESLLETFPLPPPGGGRVLLPRAAVARPLLPEGLAARGWAVEVVEAYRTRRTEPDPSSLRAALGADVVVFTSASTAEAFADLAGGGFSGRVACIGPVTAAAARRAGMAVDLEAPEHSTAGLVEALGAAVERWGSKLRSPG